MRRLFAFLLALLLALPVLPAVAEATEAVADAEPTEVIEADEIVAADISEDAVDEDVLDLSEAETPGEYVADLPGTEDAPRFEADDDWELVNTDATFYLKFGLTYLTSYELDNSNFKWFDRAAYDPNTNTLTLDNFKANYSAPSDGTSDGEAWLVPYVDNLTICLKGENEIGIRAVEGLGVLCGINAEGKNLTFTGDGSLDLIVDEAKVNCYGIKAKTMTVKDTCSVNIAVKGNGAVVDAGIALDDNGGVLTIDGGAVNINASDANPQIITFIHGVDTIALNVRSGSLTTTTGNSPYYSLALVADNINIADGLPFYFGASEAEAESHTVAEFKALFQPPYDKIPRYVRIGGKAASSAAATPASSGTKISTATSTVSAPTSTPAAPQILTLSMLKKSAKATVTAAPGALFRIDLGGAAGKKFKSSKKSVASVDQTGLLTIKKAGKTTLSVKVGKKTRKLTLKVKDPTLPKRVTLTAPTTAVKAGDTITLTAILPAGTNSPIKWKSSNKKVATVSNGVVTFKKAGKVTITATATRSKKKAKLKFKVSK